jgi:hypothetical protein
MINYANFGVAEQHDYEQHDYEQLNTFQRFRDGTTNKYCSYKVIISLVGPSLKAPIT